MANELLVAVSDDGLDIAIIEDRKLVELHHEKKNNPFSVGDVYLGVVKRLMPGLNAAFVDIGHPRDAFLHYLDLGPQVQSQAKLLRMAQSQRKNPPKIIELEGLPDIDKNGKVTDVLKSGQVVLVQIMKEPISTKGARLSSQISLAGQYIILLPFGDEASISRKIESNEEKKRLKKILESLRPRNTGIIARTAAEGATLEQLSNEVNQLMARWEQLMEGVLRMRPPGKVLSEVDRATGLARDMLSIGFDAIYTDNEAFHQEIQAYLKANQPENAGIAQLRKPRQGLFESYGIQRQIKGAFGRTVNLSSGAYLVIEHTEALHVIDVNSGSMRVNNRTPEENALKINQEAASEIARQLRLRDMGGIIVIDFIDHRNPENKRLVYEHLRDEMKRDRARHTILPMSKFGLIQITRQRVRPEVNIVTDEQCPSCNGTGKIQPSILLEDQIAKNIEYLFAEHKLRSLQIRMHPFLAAYYLQGLFSRRLKLAWKYKKWINILADNTFPVNQVKYLDAAGDEVKLN